MTVLMGKDDSTCAAEFALCSFRRGADLALGHDRKIGQVELSFGLVDYGSAQKFCRLPCLCTGQYNAAALPVALELSEYVVSLVFSTVFFSELAID